jgi:hypothetical protein
VTDWKGVEADPAAAGVGLRIDQLGSQINPAVTPNLRACQALDLFCVAGGATRGLQRACFAVTGIDIAPQPRYCGDSFVQTDALSLTLQFLRSFDFIWSSPPCQFGTVLKHLHNARPQDHSNLSPQTRELLKARGRPYVVENVENVENVREHLIEPNMLCGSMFDLGAAGRELHPHRLVETSFPVQTPVCRHSGRTGGDGDRLDDRRRALAGDPAELRAVHSRAVVGGT